MRLSPQFKQHAKTALHATTTAATVGMLTGAVAVGGMTHEAPEGGWMGSPGAITRIHAEKPSNIPTWNRQLSRQFEGYQDMSKRPKSHIPSSVVAVHQDASVREMPFDKAWDRNNDKNRGNDVWTVGYR